MKIKRAFDVNTQWCNISEIQRIRLAFYLLIDYSGVLLKYLIILHRNKQFSEVFFYCFFSSVHEWTFNKGVLNFSNDKMLRRNIEKETAMSYVRFATNFKNRTELTTIIIFIKHRTFNYNCRIQQRSVRNFHILS